MTLRKSKTERASGYKKVEIEFERNIFFTVALIVVVDVVDVVCVCGVLVIIFQF